MPLFFDGVPFTLAGNNPRQEFERAIVGSTDGGFRWDGTVKRGIRNRNTNVIEEVTLEWEGTFKIGDIVEIYKEENEELGGYRTRGLVGKRFTLTQDRLSYNYYDPSRNIIALQNVSVEFSYQRIPLHNLRVVGRRKCSACRCVIHGKALSIGKYVYCEHCFPNYGQICSTCGEIYDRQVIRTHNFRPYCPNCYREVGMIRVKAPEFKVEEVIPKFFENKDIFLAPVVLRKMCVQTAVDKAPKARLQVAIRDYLTNPTSYGAEAVTRARKEYLGLQKWNVDVERTDYHLPEWENIFAPTTVVEGTRVYGLSEKNSLLFRLQLPEQLMPKAETIIEDLVHIIEATNTGEGILLRRVTGEKKLIEEGSALNLYSMGQDMACIQVKFSEDAPNLGFHYSIRQNLSHLDYFFNAIDSVIGSYMDKKEAKKTLDFSLMDETLESLLTGKETKTCVE